MKPHKDTKSQSNFAEHSLPEREYYRLDHAAEILKCSSDDIIHWAANNRVLLCANLYGHDRKIVSTELSYDTPLSYYPTPYGMYEIPWDLMRIFEANGGLESAHFNVMDDKGYYWAITFSSPAPIHLNNLFLPALELKALQEKHSLESDNNRKPPTSQAVIKPHGNAERFATYREAVLKAAIACKAEWPDRCKTYRAWRETIEKEAYRFWPKDRVPPLNSEDIERNLGEASKLPVIGD